MSKSLPKHGRLKKGPPKDIYIIYSLEPVNATLYGKRDFVAMIHLGILGWGDSSGLSRWALNVITRFPKRGWQRKI